MGVEVLGRRFTDLSGIDGSTVNSGYDITLASHVNALGLGRGDGRLVALIIFCGR